MSARQQTSRETSDAISPLVSHSEVTFPDVLCRGEATPSKSKKIYFLTLFLVGSFKVLRLPSTRDRSSADSFGTTSCSSFTKAPLLRPSQLGTDEWVLISFLKVPLEAASTVSAADSEEVLPRANSLASDVSDDVRLSITGAAGFVQAERKGA